MNFSLNAGNVAARTSVIDFVREVINPALESDPQPQNFDKVLWRQLAYAGFFELAMPEVWSNDRLYSKRDHAGVRNTILKHNNFLNQVIVLEALGYACDDNGLPFAATVQGSTVQQTLLLHGSKEQQQDYLPSCVAGDLIGSHAMTETNAGSDSAAISTQATKKGNGYLLNGEKRMITLAPIADFYIVFANVNPTVGRWGLTAFIVDKQLEGLTAFKANHKLGLDSVPIGSLNFENCFIPTSKRLGPEGAGAAIAQCSLELERSTVLANQVGQMNRQLELAVQHTRDRKQFGQAVGQFQSVSNRLADMRLRVETAQLLLYKTAWMRDQDQSTQLESSMLKLLISESFLASSIDAMRIHGGYSYLENHDAGRDTRDALGGVLYAGTSDIQRNIIAGLLKQ